MINQQGPGDLSIIIVNWHSADFVLACLKSIQLQTSRVPYEVIVVDNASFDGCDKQLAQAYPRVIYVQTPANVGFARANNLGAEKARAEVLLFLNPDTEVRDRAIDRLYRRLEALPDAGAVGCRLLNGDGSLQTSCVQAFPTMLNQFLDTDILRGFFPRARLWGNAGLLAGDQEPLKVEAVSGACLMMRRAVFERIGGFSPEYFMYGEDLDLCFKARRAGLANYHIGEAVVVHYGGGSSQQASGNFSTLMMQESISRFMCKFYGNYYGGLYRLVMSGAAFVRLALLGILFFRRGRFAGWKVSVRKWQAILRWSLGGERWTRKVQPEEGNHAA